MTRNTGGTTGINSGIQNPKIFIPNNETGDKNGTYTNGKTDD